MGQSHPKCWTGSRYEHMECVELSGRECVSCGDPAGTVWGPYFCPPCDVVRLDGIKASLEEILQSFKGGAGV